jgi:predicted Zn-dependent protease
VTSQTKFNYAWGLLKSKNDKHQLQGIRLLTELCKEAPDRERESLYYLALGHYRRGHYANARQCIMQLLIRDPNNPQAQKLRTVIDGKVKRDGIIGLGIVSGILIGIGAVAVHFLRKK